MHSDLFALARQALWICLIAVPVVVYASGLRALRRRSRPAGSARRAHPAGLVQIAADGTLSAETAAALAAETARLFGEAPKDVSLGWRTEEGDLAGHLKLNMSGGIGQIGMIHVDLRHRRTRIGTRLLAAGEDLAREDGATRMMALAGSWQSPEFFAAAGYTRIAERPAGAHASLIWLEKVLT